MLRGAAKADMGSGDLHNATNPAGARRFATFCMSSLQSAPNRIADFGICHVVHARRGDGGQIRANRAAPPAPPALAEAEMVGGDLYNATNPAGAPRFATFCMSSLQSAPNRIADFGSVTLCMLRTG